MADFELPGYELYERLGRGGMASVYRALHLNLDREVAIKVMDPAMSADENFSERFIREARISARLTHRRILQIYDVNAHNGMNYIAMEYLPGGDLDDIIHTALPQSTIYHIMEQMTEALDYASGRGYVHRDIKPSNIMLRGEQDYVLADFGIARAANSGTQMTQAGLMVGTPSYMSPEQAKGLEVDGRSDLYALAVLWYEMMVKELPYDSESAVTTAVKHLTEAIPTLPESLAVYQDFLNQAMAKSADERFQTGREMYEALRETSLGFADDEVLTEAREPAAATESSVNEIDGSTANIDDRTSIAGGAHTQVSSASSSAVSGSRPYRLEGTEQRERMVSGMYKEEKKTSSGGLALRVLFALVVVGGAGYGGFTYWQQQQSDATVGLRTVTSGLSGAYKSMEKDKLPEATKSFRSVLTVDPGNNAAKQGLREVEMRYQAAIDQALEEQDLDATETLIKSMGHDFNNTPTVQGYRQALQLARDDISAQVAAAEAAEAQATEITTLLDQANAAMAGMSSDNTQGAKAASLFRQVIDIEPENRRALSGLSAIENYYLESVSKATTEFDFSAASEALTVGLAVFPDQKELFEFQGTLPEMEKVWQEKRSAAAAQRAQEAKDNELAAQAQKAAVEQANEGMDAVKRNELTTARAAYEELAVSYPLLDSTESLKNRLQAAYVQSTRELIDEEDYDSAEEILAQGQSLVPDGAEWPELEEDISSGRNSSRRRLGAF
jgi:serine/threonine-protein kinase PpkA